MNSVVLKYRYLWLSRRAKSTKAKRGGLEKPEAPHRDPWWPGAKIYNCNRCNMKTSFCTNITIHDNATIDSPIISVM